MAPADTGQASSPAHPLLRQNVRRANARHGFQEKRTESESSPEEPIIASISPESYLQEERKSNQMHARKIKSVRMPKTSVQTICNLNQTLQVDFYFTSVKGDRRARVRETSAAARYHSAPASDSGKHLSRPKP